MNSKSSTKQNGATMQNMDDIRRRALERPDILTALAQSPGKMNDRKIENKNSQVETAIQARGGGKKGSAKGKAKAKAIPKSKLKPKVQDFVNLIADISMMEEQMTKLGYDVSLITQRSRWLPTVWHVLEKALSTVDVDVHCYAIQRRSIQ